MKSRPERYPWYFIPLENPMPICPECDTALDLDEDEVDEGDVIVCDECGTEYEVVTTDPLEIVRVEEDYEDAEAESSEEEEE
jgi:alpha-aminoadipate/glutamate carrier protein LysW